MTMSDALAVAIGAGLWLVAMLREVPAWVWVLLGVVYLLAALEHSIITRLDAHTALLGRIAKRLNGLKGEVERLADSDEPRELREEISRGHGEVATALASIDDTARAIASDVSELRALQPETDDAEDEYTMLAEAVDRARNPTLPPNPPSPAEPSPPPERAG